MLVCTIVSVKVFLSLLQDKDIIIGKYSIGKSILKETDGNSPWVGNCNNLKILNIKTVIK